MRKWCVSVAAEREKYEGTYVLAEPDAVVVRAGDATASAGGSGAQLRVALETTKILVTLPDDVRVTALEVDGLGFAKLPTYKVVVELRKV